MEPLFCFLFYFQNYKMIVLVTRINEHPLKCPICTTNMVHDYLNWEQWLCRTCNKWFWCHLDYSIYDMDTFYDIARWRERLAEFISKRYSTNFDDDINYTELI